MCPFATNKGTQLFVYSFKGLTPKIQCVPLDHQLAVIFSFLFPSSPSTEKQQPFLFLLLKMRERRDTRDTRDTIKGNQWLAMCPFVSLVSLNGMRSRICT
jgi:hypothetical protein